MASTISGPLGSTRKKSTTSCCGAGQDQWISKASINPATLLSARLPNALNTPITLESSSLFPSTVVITTLGIPAVACYAGLNGVALVFKAGICIGVET